MRKTSICFGIVFGFLQTSSLSAQTELYSSAQVKRDLQFAYTTILQAHYNPFLYTTEEKLDSSFQFAVGSIGEDSIGSLQANTIIQRFVSSVNNGHTSLSFPVQEYIEYAQKGGTVFPLELSFEHDHVYIRNSYTNASELLPHVEILAIDERPIEAVLEELGHYTPAEDVYFEKAKVEALSFPRLYWQVYGQQETFTVSALIKGKGPVDFQLGAVSVMDGYEMKREEVLNASMYLGIENDIALLNPGSFGGDIVAFKSFIDSSFQVIRERQLGSLYIDLRNNAGGDDVFSDYLVSYIADRPFHWCSEFYLRSSAALKNHVRTNSDTTLNYAQSILKADDGEVFPFEFPPHDPQPESKRFEGQVYVLINRQTHSQAAVTAAQIVDYGWGTTMGERTGEYPSLCASLFPVALPETGFTLQLSKGYIVRVSGDTTQQGLVPMQHIVLPSNNQELLEKLSSMKPHQ